MLARVTVFLLFCCTAQRASSLSARESPSWPWGKNSQEGQEAIRREEAVRATTIASYQEDLNRTEAAVQKRKEEAEKSKHNDTKEEDEKSKRNDTKEDASPFAAAVRQELFEAKRAEEQALMVKERIQAEQLQEFNELKELTEAEKAEEQVVAKDAARIEQVKAQATEQATRDEQAVQVAEARVAQDQSAEVAVQDRVAEFVAEVEAKQRELDKVLAWGQKLKAELAAKQRQLKEATEAQQAKAEETEQAKSDVQALKAAEAHDAEQARAAQADAELVAQKHQQEVQEEKKKMESMKAEVLAKQVEIDKATATVQAKASTVQVAEAHAAAQARAAHELETKQRELKAKWQAAEQSRIAQVEAERLAKQRELKVLEKIAVDVPAKMKQKFDSELKSKESELSKATEASEQVAAQAAKSLSELTQPGCYVAIPSGCPKLPISSELWRKDKWANMQGVDKEKCQRRKGVWDKYCDSKDAQMAFVANKTSSDK